MKSCTGLLVGRSFTTFSHDGIPAAGKPTGLLDQPPIDFLTDGTASERKDARMSPRKVRILMARLGEGYEAAMMKLARAFSESGYEVIYTDITEPKAIVASAIQESVDHIGITILPGADIQDFARILELLATEDAAHIRITAGGFLPDEDIARIKALGVVEFFPKGTTYADLIKWSEENIKPTQF
jgi:methylmalonyl-CoA mutase, C-terminal domain